tara:strand:- start:356 stop:538 length:183 start_codon:yes stop_codon:yes gene_type:complete
MTLTAHEQFKRAHRALLNRWIEESDIEDVVLAQIAMADVQEFLDDDVVEFESDIELGDDE